MVHRDHDELPFVVDQGWLRRGENAELAEPDVQPWDEYTYDEWIEIGEDG